MPAASLVAGASCNSLGDGPFSTVNPPTDMFEADASADAATAG